MSSAGPVVKVEKRKGFGKMGSQKRILVNCFFVTRTPDTEIQQFDVQFSDPQVKEKRAIMAYLVEKERIFGDAGVGVVYDGRAIMFMPGKKTVDGSKEFRVNESQARGRPMRANAPIDKNLIVKITWAKSLNPLALTAFCQGSSDIDDNIQMAINALNVAIKAAPYAAFPNRKNNFYVPPDVSNPGGRPFPLGGGLEAWASYFSSIRPGIERHFMNFDRGAGVFKMSGNTIEICLQFVGRRDPRDLELSRMPPRVKVQLQRFLKGCTVQMRFSKDPNQVLKIRKVSDVAARDFMFPLGDGREDNVVHYIEQKYNIRLEHPYIPCVQLSKIAWYPLECVKLLPGSQFLGKLNPDQVRNMLKFTTQKPQEKLAALRMGLKHMRFGGQSSTLRAWNLDVDGAPMSVPARQLDPPKLLYSQRMPMVDVRDGQWDVKGRQGYKPPEFAVERWFVVVFTDQSKFNPNELMRCLREFVGACKAYGIAFRLEQPYYSYAGNCRESDVFGQIKKAGKEAGYGPQMPPQFCLTFVESKTSKQYGFVKQACDLTFAMASQNLVIPNAAKGRAQYWSNVSLKVNVKLKGMNQIIAPPVKLPGFDVPTMVFGADVTHPGPGSVSPSIAAVVASCDSNGARYSTQARAQNSREEIIVDLRPISVELIKIFIARCGNTPPQRILFFRDGVSEGQFEEVCRREIPQLKGALQDLRITNCKITYIICGKRHHVRFFPMDQRDGDRSGNVRAGTVVDSEIAHPYYNDFYLMSHAGLLGTSRPTHYTTLIDENQLGPDNLQKLAYYLAHLYPRSTRSVSIAAPAYFAHHLATRAKMYIGDDDAATTEISAGDSPDKIDAIRNEKLRAAQQSIKQVAPDLQSTFYFM